MANFKRLAAWQRAHALALGIYRATSTFPSDQRYTLSAQLQRAALSICSNIAEGCGRAGDTELRRFLRIARGSSSEVECQLLLARDLGYLPEDQWKTLNRECQLVGRMLTRLLTSLAR